MLIVIGFGILALSNCVEKKVIMPFHDDYCMRLPNHMIGHLFQSGLNKIILHSSELQKLFIRHHIRRVLLINIISLGYILLYNISTRLQEIKSLQLFNCFSVSKVTACRILKRYKKKLILRRKFILEFHTQHEQVSFCVRL